MNYLTVFPDNVKPTGDVGVFLVQSNTSKTRWHRVDLESLQCNCESATKGKAFRAQKRGMTWNNRCPHIAISLAAHALLILESQSRLNEQFPPSLICRDI